MQRISSDVGATGRFGGIHLVPGWFIAPVSCTKEWRREHKWCSRRYGKVCGQRKEHRMFLTFPAISESVEVRYLSFQILFIHL